MFVNGIGFGIQLKDGFGYFQLSASMLLFTRLRRRLQIYFILSLQGLQLVTLIWDPLAEFWKTATGYIHLGSSCCVFDRLLITPRRGHARKYKFEAKSILFSRFPV